MATSKSHYQNVLSPVYSWMYGGFDEAVARNRAFFTANAIYPSGSRIAIDLGAGSGFQSIPLAELGFEVTAIDFDANLLGELKQHAGQLSIRTIEDDLCSFRNHCSDDAELIVCMTDTILHLESTITVSALFNDAGATLEKGGSFLLTFRDLTQELSELDRFVPVRNDATTIFTCFLEYESAAVKVHDLIYVKERDGWRFDRSFYRKLRLAPDWVEDELRRAGFDEIESTTEHGLCTVVARRG